MCLHEHTSMGYGSGLKLKITASKQEGLQSDAIKYTFSSFTQNIFSTFITGTSENPQRPCFSSLNGSFLQFTDSNKGDIIFFLIWLYG